MDARYIRIGEAARLGDKTPQAISNLLRRGRIRYKEVNGIRWVLKSDVVNFQKMSPPGRPRGNGR